MNNQDQDTRFQRYDFTPKRDQHKRQRKPHVWPWILGLIMIVLILTFGIQYVLSNSNQVTNTPTPTGSTTKISSNKSTTSKMSKTNHPVGTTTQSVQTPKETNVSDNNGSSEFDQPHTFNSLQDAKDWANATKSEWTANGFNSWTVAQNSQGYFVLSFTK